MTIDACISSRRLDGLSVVVRVAPGVRHNPNRVAAEDLPRRWSLFREGDHAKARLHQSASANDASDASFRALDCDAEVVALALDRVHLAVEFADPHDAVPEADVAVVEDEVAVW